MTAFTRQNIKVNVSGGGAFTTASPITLKNQVVEINSIQDIADVSEVNMIDGATLVYNASADIYEVKPLDFGDLQVDIDGGTF